MNITTSLTAAIVFGALAVGAFVVREKAAGGTVKAFRTTRAVSAGTPFGGSFETIEIPKSTFDAMTSQVPSGELKDWVSTSPAVRNVPAGTVVAFDMIMKTADPGLQARLSKGMRAVSIQVSDVQAVAFLVRPGDLVDILATRPQGPGLSTEYVLQAKKILAVDQSYDVDTVRPGQGSFSTVTFEVTPTEAQKLEQFRVQLKDGFYLALRRQGDTEEVSLPPFTAPTGVR